MSCVCILNTHKKSACVLIWEQVCKFLKLIVNTLKAKTDHTSELYCFHVWAHLLSCHTLFILFSFFVSGMWGCSFTLRDWRFWTCFRSDVNRFHKLFVNCWVNETSDYLNEKIMYVSLYSWKYTNVLKGSLFPVFSLNTLWYAICQKWGKMVFCWKLNIVKMSINIFFFLKCNY